MTTEILTEPSIDAAFKAAAQSRYAALRALGPIHRARILNGVPCWIVVDHELAKQALIHPALVKDETPARDTLAAAGLASEAGMGRSMLFVDPPDHTRLRRLVAAAFTRGRVEALRPRVTEIAEELADAIAAAGETDRPVFPNCVRETGAAPEGDLAQSLVTRLPGAPPLGNQR